MKSEWHGHGPWEPFKKRYNSYDDHGNYDEDIEECVRCKKCGWEAHANYDDTPIVWKHDPTCDEVMVERVMIA